MNVTIELKKVKHIMPDTSGVKTSVGIAEYSNKYQYT